MKKFLLILIFLLALLLFTTCNMKALETALSQANAWIDSWNTETLNHYNYSSYFRKADNTYCIKMTLLEAASSDSACSLRAPDMVKASVAAVYPTLTQCFRGAGQVNILISVYDEAGILLGIFLNGAG